MHCNFDNQGQKTGGYWHYHKPDQNQNLYRKKYLEFMPVWVKLKCKSKSILNKSTLPSKSATMLKNVNCLTWIQDNTKPDLKK